MSVLTGMGAAVALTGVVALRRCHQRWGATDEEVAGQLPGDELVTPAAFTATRAITISAPPADIWPWLVQVGFGRAGFYSYDLLDNLGRPSTREILPEFQAPRVGDLAAPMASPANEANSFTVALIEPPTALVWAKPDSTWSWRLTPLDRGGTRLVTRLKTQYRVTPFLPVTMLLMEVGDFPMMRRMLLGIRERAEAAAGAEAPAEMSLDRDCPEQ
jgi:hypothetical protein